MSIAVMYLKEIRELKGQDTCSSTGYASARKTTSDNEQLQQKTRCKKIICNTQTY